MVAKKSISLNTDQFYDHYQNNASYKYWLKAGPAIVLDVASCCHSNIDLGSCFFCTTVNLSEQAVMPAHGLAQSKLLLHNS